MLARLDRFLWLTIQNAAFSPKLYTGLGGAHTIESLRAGGSNATQSLSGASGRMLLLFEGAASLRIQRSATARGRAAQAACWHPRLRRSAPSLRSTSASGPPASRSAPDG